MTDEELIKRLRDACRGGETCKCSLNEAADRIEELLQERQAHHANPADFRYWEGRYRDEKANLAKAVDALRATTASIEHADMSDGVCCCGDNMDGHADPMSCGHSPTDMGEYYAHKAVEMARAVLAEFEGGKDE